VENIARELLRKRPGWSGLAGKGYEVLQADAPAEHASGIVSFYQPGLIWPRCTRNSRTPGS